MEAITIQRDIKVFYIMAASFPDGIMAAYDQLHALVPPSASRNFFGISRPENGVIVYKAAVEQAAEGEAEKFGCDSLILKSGRYIAITVSGYMDDVQNIDRAFKQLLTHAGLDPQGYCVEWYFNDKDVKCMIRLQQ